VPFSQHTDALLVIMVGAARPRSLVRARQGRREEQWPGWSASAKCKDPEYYTQAAKGPEYYSAGAGIESLEPEGVWTGNGCPDLGLVIGAPTDRGVFLKLFGEHADRRDGRRLGRAMPTYKRDWQQIYQALLQAELSREDEQNLMRQAVAQVTARQNTWTRSALTRALGELLPTTAAFADSTEARVYL
jgi:hypothetical protein